MLRAFGRKLGLIVTSAKEVCKGRVCRIDQPDLGRPNEKGHLLTNTVSSIF
jgi:hypothetical protein